MSNTFDLISLNWKLSHNLAATVHRGSQQHLRALQNSGSNNNGSPLAPFFVVFFFFFVCVFFCVVLFISRACRSGCGAHEPEQTTTTRSSHHANNRAVAAGTTPQTTTARAPQQQADEAAPPKVPDRREIERQLITRHYIDEDSDHKDCSICLSSFEKGQEVAQSVNSGCTHLFHTDCIVDWLVLHPACPECRREFLTT